MRSLRFWLLGSLLLSLNAAGLIWIHHDLTGGPAGKLRVLELQPASAQVDYADRIGVVIDEPLGAGKVGKPADWSPFEIAPKMDGHWQWAADDRVEFVLDRRLPPGRAWVVRAAADLEPRTGRRLVGTAEFRLQTRAPQLNECRLASADRESITIELTFNQPVHPDEVLRHLICRDTPADPNQQGADLKPTVLTGQVAEKIMVRARRPAATKIDITITAKLTGFGGQIASTGDDRRGLDVPTRFSLLGAHAEQPSLEKLVTVRLAFSAPLDRTQPTPAIDIQPKLDGVQVSREDDCIRLSGPFQCGKRYAIAVEPTLRSRNKETLGDRQSAVVEIPDRDPATRFPMSEGILCTQGNLMLDLEAVNVGKLKLGASRLHANNLVSHLHGSGTEQTSRTLKTSEVRLDLPHNVVQKVAIDLRKLVGDAPGVYRVEVSKPLPHGSAFEEDPWANDAAVVAVTNLAITAKQQAGGYLVWVTSLREGQGAGDVKVTAITANNQVIASATTDADGLATLPVPRKHPDGECFVITAEKDGDLSFLQPDQHWDTSDFDTFGRAAPGNYDVMLYTDRGVYRPGETIHVRGIVRDGQGRLVPPMPLSLSAYRPDGKRMAEIAIAADDSGQGLLAADVPTPEEGQTGNYRLQVTLPGAKEALGTAAVLVEAFAPVRMEVTAKPTADLFLSGQDVSVKVAARYLFGSPGSDLPATLRGRFVLTAFSSPQWKDFIFDDAGRRITPAAKDAAGTLDAQGVATLTVQPPREKGVWIGNLSATVAEPGGRSVSANFATRVDTVNRHVGLKMPDRRIVPAGEEQRIAWCYVDGAGAAVDCPPLHWTLSRVEWDWSIEQTDGRRVWRSFERVIKVSEGDIAAGTATGEIQIQCPEPAHYRLEAADAAGGAKTVADFYASLGGQGSATPAKPQRLELVLDRQSYRPGSSAKLLIRSPFAGKALVTIESDRILDRRLVDVPGQQMELDIPVPADLRGAAFVTASLVRPLDPAAQKWLPVRAMGITRLRADHTDSRLPVTIQAPARILPRQKLTATVIAEKPADPNRPAVVHLWAVDEGVLLITGFGTPNPMSHFFAGRKLQVGTADPFDDLMPDFQRPADQTRIGGDGGEAAMSLRRSPVATRVRAPVVLWSKAAAVDADGKAVFAMDLPAFTGELRLMAVVVDGDRYGSAQQPVTVTAPLIVEASGPRFAAPGDQMRLAIKVFNNSEQPMAVRGQVKVKGAMQLIEEDDPAPANEPYRAWWAEHRPASAPATASAPASSKAPASGPMQNLAIVVPYEPGIAFKPIAAADALKAGVAMSDRNDFSNQPPFHWSTPAATIEPGQSMICWLDARMIQDGKVDVDVSAEGIAEAGDAGDEAATQTGATQPSENRKSKIENRQSADDEFHFAIRTAVPLASASRVLKLDAGQDQAIDPAGDFSVSRTRLAIYGRPLVELRPALESLMDYPYGCVEQTTSRLYGILRGGDLLASAGEKGRSQGAREMVQAGIHRLWSMQCRDGGLSYWPGQWEHDLWGTCHAASFLAQAKKSGYEVDKRFTDPLLEFLELNLRKLEPAPNEDANNDNIRADMAYVLAAFGRPAEGWMNRLSDRPDRLDIAGRAHLAAAWLELGRADRAKAALPEDTLNLAVSPSTAGRLGSPVSQQATLLDVLLDLDPHHPWVPLLAARLQQARQPRGTWLNTLENALCLSALSRYQALGEEPSSFQGTVRIAGRPDEKFASDKVFCMDFSSGDKPAISTTGQGPIFAVVTTEGLPKDGKIDIHDRNLIVRRQWLDGQDNVMDADDLTDLYVGQLIKVRIEVKLPSGVRGVSNIAIVDALPGGMEIENPRLRTAESSEQTVMPAHCQFLDDRVVLFMSMPSPTTYTCSYLLRVTSVGTFTQPPLQASCMYDPQISSVSGGGTIRVGADRPPLKCEGKAAAAGDKDDEGDDEQAHGERSSANPEQGLLDVDTDAEDSDDDGPVDGNAFEIPLAD